MRKSVLVRGLSDTFILRASPKLGVGHVQISMRTNFADRLWKTACEMLRRKSSSKSAAARLFSRQAEKGRTLLVWRRRPLDKLWAGDRLTAHTAVGTGACHGAALTFSGAVSTHSTRERREHSSGRPQAAGAQLY